MHALFHKTLLQTDGHLQPAGQGLSRRHLRDDHRPQPPVRWKPVPEPAELVTPETSFERAWALQVLRAALDGLHQTEVKAGHGRIFEILSSFLDPETAADARTDRAALELGMSAEGVRQAVGRRRRKFRLALRRQVATTLHDPGDT